MSVKAKGKTNLPSVDKTHLVGIDPKNLHPKVFSLSMLAIFLIVNFKTMHESLLIDEGKSYSKSLLKQDALTMARALIKIGLKRGDTLAIITPNCYKGIVLTFAANAIGVKVTYFNHLETEEQTIASLQHYQAKAALVHHKTAETARRIMTNAPGVKAIIDTNSFTYRSRFGDHQYVSYDTLLNGAKGSRQKAWPKILANLTNHDDLIYLQTSGSSSGKPKGLPFTNRNVFAALIYAKNSTGTKTNDNTVDKVLSILPYRLPYGWMILFMNLLGGNLVELASGATPDDIAEYHKLKPSHIFGTPMIFRDFMERTPSDADLSFLKAFYCSGFSISEEWYQEGIEYLRAHGSNAEIRNNYGIGEGLCIGTASDGVPHRPDTSGKFYVGPEWVIVDKDGNEVKYGEKGELMVWAETLCNGYYKDPVATKEAFVPFRGKRFYRTKDYFSLSEDGYVSFLGREKRFYQPEGATDKVNCETIERALNGITDLVAKAAVVIYAPDGIHETSKAFVVLANGVPDTKKTKAKLFERLRELLLSYQMPNDIAFLPDLPIMNSGKPDYVALEKMC